MNFQKEIIYCNSGNLERWFVEEKIFLLNAYLTCSLVILYDSGFLFILSMFCLSLYLLIYLFKLLSAQLNISHVFV